MATDTHGTKAIVAAFVANLGIAIGKFIGFLLTGASSMLAEAVHSVADSGNQGLLLLGGRQARRTATSTHPFGYGRERYFWSFIVALVLFTLGGLFSLREGWDKLRHPHEVGSIGVAATILVIAIILELFSLRTAVKEAQPQRGDASWWTFIRRSRLPELPVVLLEDVGALLGLVIALVGVVLAHLTQNPMWDAVGALTIGSLLVVIGAILAMEMKSLLIGEAATRENLDAITAVLSGHPGIAALLDLKTLHIGPAELLVAAKVELADGHDVASVARIINDVERKIRGGVRERCRIYIEPDLSAVAPRTGQQ